MENHSTNNESESHKKKSEMRTVSIRIPKLSMPSVQSFVLILLIVAGILQTVQLYGLQKNIASAKVNTSSVNTAAPAGGQGGSVLPQMVGGC